MGISSVIVISNSLRLASFGRSSIDSAGVDAIANNEAHDGRNAEKFSAGDATLHINDHRVTRSESARRTNALAGAAP